MDDEVDSNVVIVMEDKVVCNDMIAMEKDIGNGICNGIVILDEVTSNLGALNSPHYLQQLR